MADNSRCHRKMVRTTLASDIQSQHQVVEREGSEPPLYTEVLDEPKAQSLLLLIQLQDNHFNQEPAQDEKKLHPKVAKDIEEAIITYNRPKETTSVLYQHKNDGKES